MDSIWEDEKNCNPGELLEKAKTVKEGAVTLFNTLQSMVTEVTDELLEATDDYIETVNSYIEVNDIYDEDEDENDDHIIRNSYYKRLVKHMDMVEKAEKSFDYEKKHNNMSKISEELSSVEKSFNKHLISIEKDMVEAALKNKTEKDVLEKSKRLWIMVKEAETKVTKLTSIIESLIAFRNSWNKKFDTQTIINRIQEEREKEKEKEREALKKDTDIKHIILGIVGLLGLILIAMYPAILLVGLFIGVPVVLLCWMFS